MLPGRASVAQDALFATHGFFDPAIRLLPLWRRDIVRQLIAAEWSAMGLHEEAGIDRTGGPVCPTSAGNPPCSHGGGCVNGAPRASSF